MGNSIYDNLYPTEFDDISTYELESRPSKVTTKDFASPVSADPSFAEFVDSLPDILAAKSIKSIASALVEAREKNKPIIWGMGGHVIKTGLAPVLNDLIDRGFLTAIACNGSVLVHDSEIAKVGFTSEDVDATLGEGDFGAAKETGELLNKAARIAHEKGVGFGEAVSGCVYNSSPRFSEHSLLFHAYENKIPVTTHLTIGADIGHFHPGTVGANLGAASHHDFKVFTTLVGQMDGGGVYLNVGSAVTMPEIFLKAVTVNRNLGNGVRGITTANFDFIQHYRPLTNVVRRPNANGAGKGYSITGHHELTIPFLAALLK